MNTGNLKGILAAALITTFAAGCANTMRGVKADTEKAMEKTGGGIETMEVKAALIADGRVDAGKDRQPADRRPEVARTGRV